MAAPTRLYFSGTSAAFNVGGSVNAAGVNSMWEGKITLADTTKKLTLTADGTLAMASNASVIGSGTNPNDWWYYSGMTDTLPNGKVLNGNFQGVCCCRESATNTNAFTQCAVYVVDSGGSLLATLIAPQTGGAGTEYNNPSANTRSFPRTYLSGSGVALSSYTTVNATSRIVIEWGTRIETTRTADTVYMYLGNNGGSDLPQGDGASNSLVANPWVEFSIDLFAAPAGGGAKSIAAVSMGYWDRHDDGLFLPADYRPGRRIYAFG